MHITDYLQRNAAEEPDKIALVFEEKTLNWLDLWQTVEVASQSILRAADSDEQQVIALLLPNSIDFVVSYLAILHAGHIAFPLDPAYKRLELDAIIDQLRIKLLIANDHYRQQIGEHELAIVEPDELLGNGHKNKSPIRRPINKQIASLTFTSGTTGRPKAVPNTHANHIWNIEVCSKVWDWTPMDSLLISSPLSHMLGIVMGLSGAIYHGNRLYLHQWFDEHETLRALSSGKISFFSHAASAYVKLVQAQDKGYDLSPVRLCVSGAAPLPPEVWRQFRDRFGIEIRETYGTSETGRIAANALAEYRLGSPGKLLPDVDMQLGKNGEVQIKSPGVFPGYFHNKVATRQSFTEDGYFRTGDIGEMHDNDLYLKGRTHEQIRRFGYTVSPRDVEWAMHQHPQIRDIYVTGRQAVRQPNDELVYFVVGEVSDQQIKNYCKQNLLFAWRPDRIVHLESLPRTNSGKPRVTEFRKLVWQGI